MIEIACRYEKPVRIGVNWGSLDPDLLTRLMDENSQLPEPQDAQEVMREAVVQSALTSAARAEELGLPHERIILSAKVSGVQDLIAIYRDLGARCDYPLHLGLTEAGMGSKGIVASTAGMAVLLQEGIGDTIRVSLTPEPNGDRTQEVIVAQEILQTMGLRSFTPLVIACPGCGRTTSTFFQQLAQRIQSHIRTRMPQWRREYAGVEEMTVAVMGCVVNGPGESKHANIGISLPGTGERPVAPVYEDGAEDRDAQGRAHRRGIPGHRRAIRGAPLRAAGKPMSDLASRMQTLRRRHAAADARAGARTAAADLERLGAQRECARAAPRVSLPGLLSHHELRERARARRQHRGSPSGSGGRLQLLPRQLHDARRRGLSENDFVCAAKVDLIPLA